MVDREGRVALPEAGSLQVSGMPLEKVQQVIETELRRQYQGERADVSISRIRSVRVYVVGDVAHPGPYDVSALSTPLNAVFIAGGPTSRGSIRTIKHYRGNKLVQDVDVYGLVLNGIRTDLQNLAPGDTILVPPIGAEVTLEGMVRRPAIYELHGEKNLSEALSLAGGVLSTGTLRHIEVERLVAHEKRVELSLDLPEDTSNGSKSINDALESFNVQDGDRIRISAILPYTERSIYLDGHVYRPGKYSFHDGMHINDLVKSFADLQPEPYQAHAELIRLAPPDYKPVVLAFNLGDALQGKTDANLALQPFDTIRIFGRFDFEDEPSIFVSGEVRSPGEHQTSGEIHVRDAIFLAGGLTPDAQESDAQIFRRDGGKTKVFSVDLQNALKGDATNNILLHPKDRLVVHRNLARIDPPSVFIQGEVAKPGKYPLGEGMTASQLVRAAGGFKRSAFTEQADLTRFQHVNNDQVQATNNEINIARALTDANVDVPLQDGDTLTIRQLTGWKDLGAAITVRGEVNHPSTYGIQEGERLSSILIRAGGLRTGAYPQGAVLERAQLRELEEQQREDLIHRLDLEQQNFKIQPNGKSSEELALRQSFFQQQQLILDKLKSAPAVGRLVIKINPDIDKWKGTPDDIEVRAGDVITVPKRPEFVVVSGQVYNPTAITYRPGKSARWYLEQAGGATQLGNKKAVFVVRANGSVVGGSLGGPGWWGSDALGATLYPGDTIVVPERLLMGGSKLTELVQSAEIIASVALSVSVALK